MSTITITSAGVTSAVSSDSDIDTASYCRHYGGPVDGTAQARLDFVVAHVGGYINQVVTGVQMRQAEEAARQSVLEEQQTSRWQIEAKGEDKAESL